MRRAYHGSVIENDKGEIFALNLGADFCAEHEWGIEQLRSLMGLSPEAKSTEGLIQYSAKVQPKNSFLSFVSSGNLFIVVDPYISWERSVDALKKVISEGKMGSLYLSTWKGKTDDFVGSWCESSFGIVINKDATKIMEFGNKLAKAIEQGDYSVWFGGDAKGNPFARSGLVVAITSMVPQEVQDYMVKCHKEQHRLEKADKATGIKNLLEKKGKSYYACSPRFMEDGVTVEYWLNPQEQDKHDFGWYSVQELTDGANGVEGNKIDKQPKSETIAKV